MVTQEQVNRFLDTLRIDGKINMYGAAPYVAEAFGIPKDEARKMTTVWMESFK